MKTNLSKLTKILLSSLILTMFTVQSYSQVTNTYNCYLKNITYVDCKHLDFEIWLEFIGTNTQQFQFFQAGINFNYAGMANGGTMTEAFQAGSADASLPAVQRAPNSNLNATSKQIRILAAIATPSSIAVPIPAPPGFRLGRFRITNTADFTLGSTPNFTWRYVTGSGSTTQTNIALYLAGATTGTSVTDSTHHFVESNPPFILTCGATCAVVATIDQITAPVCLGGTNDSVRVTLTGSGTTPIGTYSLDGSLAVPYLTNPFTITGLTAGSHTVTVITATPCTSNVAQFTINPGADPNDNNVCTIDGCDPLTGPFHTTIPSDDGNACTTDGCNSVTGVFNTPVNTDDGNACTTDACNTLTGTITHTPVNSDDGNACTTDACNTLTGVSHTPVATDDGDACTTDACNTSSGVVTHTAVVTDDGNACTTDGCNSITGVFHNPVNTSDDNACTTDACNSTTGVVTHTAVITDDGNACTTDGCNSITGVFHTATATDDGNACTTDACNTLTGVVTHTAVNTDDGNACTTDACNTLTGAMTHTAVTTDDGNACTTDGCNSITGVFHNPVNTDDGNACTTDACNTSTGVVTHTPVNTDDGNTCTTDACNSTTGVVTHTAVITDDGNACTTDGCNSITGVFHTATATDDGNACTTDACNTLTGIVTHTAVNTEDGNACTTDACNTLTGAITHTAVTTDDGNACTTDGCNSITGVFHNPVPIDDGNVCTTDGCNSLTGVFHIPIIGCNNGICVNPPTADGGGPYTSCGNVPLNGTIGGSATGGTWFSSTGGTFIPNSNTLNATYLPSALDFFNGSVTLTLVSNNPAGPPCIAATSAASVTFTPVVSDNNACTIDACNPVTGQTTHTPVNIYDNNACTTDACNPVTGVITHTTLNPDDGNICTADGCNIFTGIFNIPVNTDDGNACTIDACNTLTGISHTPVNINDGIACTFDACNTTTGVITHTNDTPTVTATPGTIGCYSGTTCVTVTATGGLLPYNGTGIFCGYGSGTYSFDVTDAKGCTGSSPNFTISDPPKLSVITSSTPSGCILNNGTATATPVGGTPGYSYLWTPGGQTTNPATGLAPGNYLVIVTDANGCTVTSTVVVGSSGVVPSAPIFISGPGGVCKKQSGIVYCVAQIPGVTSYVWTLPAGVTVIGSATGPCITLSFSSKFKGGFICVRAVSPCGFGPINCMNVILLKKKPATPGPIAGSVSLCPSSSGIYSIAAVQFASSYIWTGNNGLVIVSGQGTTTIVVSAPAGFNDGELKVRASNCKDKSGDRVLKLITIPSKPGGIAGLGIVCKSQDNANSINPVDGATSYLWSATNGVVVISGQGSTNVIVRFTGATSNSIALSVIAVNSCGSSPAKTKNIDVNFNCRLAKDGITEENPTGVTDELAALSVYPNPTSGKVTLSFNSAGNIKYSIRVFDVTGRVMIIESISAVVGYNTKEINLENVAKGIYMVSIQSEGMEAKTLRIVVE